MNFLDLIKSFFTLPREQSALEQFINSKRPTSAADVEHWTRYFYDNKSRFL